jgi:hypothetical protein
MVLERGRGRWCITPGPTGAPLCQKSPRKLDFGLS